MNPFDEAIALAPVAGAEPGRFSGRTHPAWGNMVGPFGGSTAATALNAVLRHPQRMGTPIALTVNFAAALADGPFELLAVPVRTNRSTQHWTVAMAQADGGGAPQTVLTATAVTAARRETWSTDEVKMPRIAPPAEVASAGVRGVEWVNRYDIRIARGALPTAWDGGGDDSGRGSLTQLWVRDQPERPLDFCSLMALSDIFFPRAWTRRAKHVPVGTVSITTYIHADAAMLARTGSGFVLAQCEAQAFRNGFSDQSAQLWNEGGELLATSHQIVYFKE